MDNILLSALFLLIAVPLGRRLLRRRDVFDPLTIFLVLYFCAHFMKPLLLLYNPNLSTFSGFQLDDTFSLGLMLSIMGLLFFYGGYYFPPLARQKRVESGALTYQFDRARTAAFLSLLVGMSMFAGFVIYFGGYISMVSSAFAGRGNVFIGLIGLTLVTVYFLYLALLLCMSYLNHLRADIWQNGLFYGVFAAVLLAVIAFGGRGPVVNCIVLVAFYYHYRYRRLGMRAFAVLCVGLLGFVFLTDLARSPAYYGLGKTGWDHTWDVLVRTFANTFDPFDNFLIILRQIPSDQPFFLGRIHVESLFYPFIPRLFFPEKAVLWGTWILQDQLMPGGYQNVSFSVSALAPGYADFGWFGVAFDMFVAGYLLRALVRRRIESPNDEAFLMLHANAILALTAFILNGLPQFVFSVPFWLATYFVFRFIQPRLRAAPAQAAFAPSGAS